MQLGDQDKEWSPHIVCQKCFMNLHNWSRNKLKSLPFGIPMIWREPTNHIDDCYFCIVKTVGFNQKNKSRIQYPSIPSAIRRVPHSDEIPIQALKKPELEPVITDCYQFLPDSDPDISGDMESPDETIDEDYIQSKPLETFNQEELNDLVRELALSKAASERLASRLYQKNLLAQFTKVSYYRDREQQFLPYFAQVENCVYCCDIEGLLKELGLMTYDPNDWRLFIDSSKRSLKVVLLNNGNRFGSIPLAYSVTLKEKYENVNFFDN